MIKLSSDYVNFNSTRGVVLEMALLMLSTNTGDDNTRQESKLGNFYCSYYCYKGEKNKPEKYHPNGNNEVVFSRMSKRL